MKMLITSDWLRRKNETEPDLEIEAGLAVEHLPSLAMFMPPDVVAAITPDPERVKSLRHAFGVFVKSLRLRDEMTVASLAKIARVMPEHIQSIENDASYKTPPRTVVQLAEAFDVPTPKMMVLAGAADSHDTPIEDAALKYAAKSDGLSSLSAEEQAILSAFVKYLSEG